MYVYIYIYMFVSIYIYIHIFYTTMYPSALVDGVLHDLQLSTVPVLAQLASLGSPHSLVTQVSKIRGT